MLRLTRVCVCVCVCCSVIGYIVVGLLGAWCYPKAPDNILRVLVSSESNEFTRICATLFAMGIIGLGIPVFCIMMRYSLIVGEVCRPAFASFWGVAFPWLVGWLLYQGHSAQALINYTGNIVNGTLPVLVRCGSLAACVVLTPRVLGACLDVQPS